MRNETAMMELITGFAKQDDRVRAALMNGSRANPNAPRDIFQDYDIVYIVRETASFTANHSWIDIFGPRLMLQMPEEGRWPDNNGRFAYLILFEDGGRLDLSLIPADRPDLWAQDSETIPLLDKDGILPAFPPSSDADYHVKKPSAHFFAACCNNFWWCSQNVAKGIWRNELPYAAWMLEHILREELCNVMDWAIGLRSGFAVSPGKCGKYYKNFLRAEEYTAFMASYAIGEAASLWQGLFAQCQLFRAFAKEVAAGLGYLYPQQDDANMMRYLTRVETLPQDATAIME